MSIELGRADSSAERYSAPVIATLESCGLDLEQVIVFGGSVLALHGIRPAHDVDLLVQFNTFKLAEKTGQLPGGQPVAVKETKIRGIVGPYRLVTPDKTTPTGLPIDLTAPYDFEEELPETEQLTVDGLTLHCRTLEAILLRKTNRTKRPKDLLDIWRIKRQLGTTSIIEK